MSKKKKEDKETRLETRLKTLLKSRMGAKDIVKKNQVVVKIPESKPHSILNEENKFFTREFNKEKRALFLS